MDLLALKAILDLDSSKYSQGLDSAKSMATAVGKGISTAFKVGTAAVGAATTAVSVFGKKAVDSYASYEQLVGGVEKLYGSAAGKLEQFANQAYKTSGMSANEYMETATSFSAALINSLEGDVNKAADITDVAMKAMSDNVNVFGSSADSVRNAFQGFAKQNYTMLDNLKLGYGGTKTEMERLIADANKYRESIGQTANLSIDSFADVVQAIQSVQEAQNIAGTTNKEAMSTIEGSATAAKAAWENVITAIGRGEGIEKAFDALIESVFGGKGGGGLLSNIVPRIQTVMGGIGDFIAKAAPLISEKIPEIVKAVLPSVITGGIELAKALGSGILVALPDVVQSVITALGETMPALAEPLQGLWDAITGTFGWLIDHQDVVLAVIAAIAGGFMTYKTITGVIQAVSTAQAILNAVMSANPIGIIVVAIGALVAALAVLWAKSEAFREFAKKTFEGIGEFFGKFGEKIGKVKDDIVEKWNNLKDKTVETWNNIKDKTTETWNKVKENTAQAWSNIKDKVKENGGGIQGVLKTYVDVYKQVWQVGFNALDQVTGGALSKVVNTIKNKFTNIKDAFSNLVDGAKRWGIDMIENFIGGITSKIKSVTDAVGKVASTVKSFLGFSEPENGPLSNFHTFAPDMMKLFAQGIKDNTSLITDQISKSFDIQSELDGLTSNLNYGVVDQTSNSNSRVTQLLEELVQKDNIVVVDVSGDKIFNITRKKNNEYIKANGVSAFARG